MLNKARRDNTLGAARSIDPSRRSMWPVDFPVFTPLNANCFQRAYRRFASARWTNSGKRGAMDAAGARQRIKRLTTLIHGLTKVEQALQADMGLLAREERTQYLGSIWSAKEAVEDARAALQMAARRR
jgi:hypothetical protein